jgi:hypothetical protein
MAVRCSKCGEELLGAVNRCWKCGQTFALHPEIDGRPPVRAETPFSGQEPLEAIVLDAATKPQEGVAGQQPAAVVAAPPVRAPAALATPQRVILPRRASTAEQIDARRAGMMAMGGTVTSLVLGVFAAGIALAWPPAAFVAVLGLAMGIWGLHSPKRNWALVGMLLCCLAIGFGAFGGARRLYQYYESQRPVLIEDTPTPDPDDQ